ncbi:MAG: hypothetical protein EOO65_05520 [Methanosarcinales archaeon]|nr:MAG: hypothetical protein EOO65_05520 [Methanosarcinales archaeon]
MSKIALIFGSAKPVAGMRVWMVAFDATLLVGAAGCAAVLLARVDVSTLTGRARGLTAALLC